MSPAEFLPHAHDDCTGEWQATTRQVFGQPPTEWWCCPACGAMHPRTPENDAAELREYLAGVQLRSQTRQGRFHDLRPRPPREIIDLPNDESDGSDPAP